jgi:hypothetical protein
MIKVLATLVPSRAVKENLFQASPFGLSMTVFSLYFSHPVSNTSGLSFSLL